MLWRAQRVKDSWDPVTRCKISEIFLYTVAAAAGLMAFIGLPILAWGIGDARGFFGHPARLLYCLAAVLAQTVALMVLPQAGLGRGAGKTVVKRQRLAVPMLQVLFLAVVIAAPYGDRRGIAALPPIAALRYAGLALFVFGFGLLIWATARLGRQFSVQVTIREDHRLITDGPYRLVRHPRYLGILLFLAGVCLVFRSWLGLVFVAATALVLAWRVHDEEALMKRTFGAEWEAYRRRTWRIVPFLY